MENKIRTAPQELLSLVTALEKAVNMRFMSAEHAATVWKSVLKISDVNVLEVEKKKVKKEVKKNGISKKS